MFSPVPLTESVAFWVADLSPSVEVVSAVEPSRTYFWQTGQDAADRGRCTILCGAGHAVTGLLDLIGGLLESRLLAIRLQAGGSLVGGILAAGSMLAKVQESTIIWTVGYVQSVRHVVVLVLIWC